MKLRSVMEHTFSAIPRAEIQRSSFNRSHGYKTTFDCDKLIPIFVDEALPGDTFNLSMTSFARLATPIHPLMDNMFMDFFFFAVPMRLVWENWEKFNGAQDSPGDSTDFTIPVLTPPVGGWLAGSLADYFGIPTEVELDNVSSLPIRAYYRIWNEWFRDENMSASIALGMETGDGPDTLTAGTGTILSRFKRHDYFTSCLPWPQKGDSVDLPIGTTAPVIPEDPTANSPNWVHRAALPFPEPFGAGDAAVSGWSLTAANPGTMQATNVGGVAQGASRIQGAPGDPSTSGMVADLTNATAATINQLRQAFAIQKLLERDARGGTRYTEIVRSHFGVVSPDARLQRPEYLGGGSVPVNVNPVAQTSMTSASVESGETPTPQGNLAAFGTATANRIGFTKSFTEHCILIGLVNVRADLTYQQGLNRMWSRQTRFDFYWPALAHIGEQAVLSKEIYADGTANDEDVFGYQERYAEYRYKPSMVTGLFRSNATGTLESWHLAQNFTARPLLNANFMVSSTPLDRAIAVPDEPHFIFDSYFNLTCARPMPLYGVPGFVDRF